jgi:HlyD family secretion protein
VSRRTVFILLVAIISAAGVAFLTQTDLRGEPTARIVTAAVTRGTIVDAVAGEASIEPKSMVDVGAQVGGTISAINVDFNDLVKKGDVLARIDPAFVEAQIDQAQANVQRARAEAQRLQQTLISAQRTLTRIQKLKAGSVVAQTELEKARLAVQVAQAQLEAANAQVKQAEASLTQRQVDLEHTIVRAPLDGVIISRRIEVGQTVSARVEAPVLFVIAPAFQEMQAVASIRESDIGRIHPGLPVSLRTDAYPSRTFSGTVKEIRLQATSPRRLVTYPTVIDVPNENFRLRPGMTANVAIELARRDNVVRVPMSALRFQPTKQTFELLGYDPPADVVARLAPDESANDEEDGTDDPLFMHQHQGTSWQDDVWAMRDGRLTPIDVTLGINDGQLVELVSGNLVPGDELVWSITDGGNSIRPARRPFSFGRNNRNNRRGR